MQALFLAEVNVAARERDEYRLVHGCGHRSPYPRQMRAHWVRRGQVHDGTYLFLSTTLLAAYIAKGVIGQPQPPQPSPTAPAVAALAGRAVGVDALAAWGSRSVWGSFERRGGGNVINESGVDPDVVGVVWSHCVGALLEWTDHGRLGVTDGARHGPGSVPRPRVPRSSAGDLFVPRRRYG